MGKLDDFIPDDAVWQKAERSNTVGNQCIEVAQIPAGVAFRNSNDPDGPKTIATREEMAAFMHGVKAGEFDHLV